MLFFSESFNSLANVLLALLLQLLKPLQAYCLTTTSLFKEVNGEEKKKRETVHAAYGPIRILVSDHALLLAALLH